jgi:hypothetical protein
MPNARTLPNPDHLPPREALREVLLAEHAKLTRGRETRKRREAIASCARMLFQLEFLNTLEMVR